MELWKNREGTQRAEPGDSVSRIGAVVIPEGAVASVNEIDGRLGVSYNRVITVEEIAVVQNAMWACMPISQRPNLTHFDKS